MAAVPSMLTYRRNFRPSEEFPQPHAILAASVICADTDEEAEDLALSVAFAFFSLYTGRSHGPLLSPAEVKAKTQTLGEQERAVFKSIGDRHIVGSPATALAKLIPLIEQTRADELMILTMVHNHAARLHSYDLLAKSFEVEVVRAVAQPL
jgi:alkanesulfonate monooxygenase SsuD/methylene tetrahydromethanopterin reductase-like flavin-dependent oxidoreductase (luciferase family)